MNNKVKRVYSTPEIECVELDNEISLILHSAGTEEENPDEDPWASRSQNKYNYDPYKSNLG